MEKEEITKLASDHIDWFLKAIRPLLIDNFVHGYKHGHEDTQHGKINKNEIISLYGKE
jgi:hypothetical protein